MSLSEPYDDRLMADLAAAADGTLPRARQVELEQRAAGDPELAAALDEQRRAVTLIRGAAAEVRAPLALRERLEADRARLARPRARRRWFSVALAGAAVAARRCSRSSSPGRPGRRSTRPRLSAHSRRPGRPRRPRASCWRPSRAAWRSPSGARSSAGRRAESAPARSTAATRRRSTTRRRARRSPTRSSAATRWTSPTTLARSPSRARRSSSSAPATAARPRRGSATATPACSPARACRTRSSRSSPAGRAGRGRFLAARRTPRPPLARAVEPAHHRPLGHAQRVRRLLVGQPRDVDRHERVAELLRQRGDPGQQLALLDDLVRPGAPLDALEVLGVDRVGRAPRRLRRSS